ncbi:hypothetical protein DVH24_039702 [Malus domestica]|uniref:Uncharacterized protein n=1 Tax=Malus domestica TaxID=3750 RepID=A0A498I888_MALDO|nr:hypothetical protein DVH24_039702 [Malus domestica]
MPIQWRLARVDITSSHATTSSITSAQDCGPRCGNRCYKIKVKIHVMINEWQIGRDPKLYEQPEEFESERFLNSEIDYKENDFQLIPFGAGRRPGGASGEDFDMTESTGLTTHKKDPLRAVAIPYLC